MKSLMRTDVGRVRKNNEDAAFAQGGLYLLCDGMGGHQAGDVASGMAIETLSQALLPETANVGALVRAIRDANERIYQRAGEDASLRGMGTTLTAMWAAGDQMLLAQIGDSRAYRLRGGVLQQCTHDHSMVAELVRMGKLTQEEARVHPHKNLVTRALGTDPRVEADVFEISRQPGDRWILCSDGLTDQVTDAEIARVLEQEALETAAETLLQMALGRGGPDNITLILVDDEGGEIV